MPAPTYLAKDRHGGYLFRITIPVELRPAFSNNKTIRKSLRTYRRATALRRARRWASIYQEVFDSMSAKTKYRGKILAARGRQSLLQKKLREQERRLTPDQVEMLRDADFVPSGALLELINDIDSTMEALSAEIRAQELKEENARLQLAEAESIEQAQRIAQLKEEVWAEYGLQSDSASIQPVMTNSGSTVAAGPSLSECWEEYRAHKIRTRKWKEETTAQQNKIKEYDAQFRDILEILNLDPAVSLLDRSHVNQIVEGLLAWPKNRSKVFPNLSLQEIPGDAPRISVSTASQRLDTLKGFFRFLEQEEYTRKDWLKDIHIERDSKSYPTPTQKDIAEWFNLPEELIWRAWQFWIPRIALYSGARQNEIAQLSVSDISADEESGIWCMTIHDSGGNTVKSKAGARRVPLHSSLIENGLLDYRGSLIGAGETAMWPDLGAKAGKKGATVSAYWTALKNKHKVLSNPVDSHGREKVFHSLRRVIINKLLKVDVELLTIQCIVGHEPSLGSTREYLDEPATLEQMKRAIEKLAVKGVSWSHPKKLEITA